MKKKTPKKKVARERKKERGKASTTRLFLSSLSPLKYIVHIATMIILNKIDSPIYSIGQTADRLT